MIHKLEFEKLLNYDAGIDGISLNVELRLGDNSTNFAAKIDTGSTFCVFERAHGEALGLDVESGFLRRISTVVGSFSAHGHGVTIVTADFEFDSWVFFVADESFRVNVLGRNGWLNRLIIGINDYDGKLYLSRYESE
ncbi:MAG: aspartyl protease family protein [Pyrinomonadaceae bacterium]